MTLKELTHGQEASDRFSNQHMNISSFKCTHPTGVLHQWKVSRMLVTLKVISLDPDAQVDQHVKSHSAALWLSTTAIAKQTGMEGGCKADLQN